MSAGTAFPYAQKAAVHYFEITCEVREVGNIGCRLLECVEQNRDL